LHNPTNERTNKQNNLTNVDENIISLAEVIKSNIKKNWSRASAGPDKKKMELVRTHTEKKTNYVCLCAPPWLSTYLLNDYVSARYELPSSSPHSITELYVGRIQCLRCAW